MSEPSQITMPKPSGSPMYTCAKLTRRITNAVIGRSNTTRSTNPSILARISLRIDVLNLKSSSARVSRTVGETLRNFDTLQKLVISRVECENLGRTSLLLSHFARIHNPEPVALVHLAYESRVCQHHAEISSLTVKLRTAVHTYDHSADACHSGAISLSVPIPAGVRPQ